MYIVIEIQNGSIGENTWTYTDRNTAFSKYYSVLAAAATSTVAVHTAMITREDGQLIAVQSFLHGDEGDEEEP